MIQEIRRVNKLTSSILDELHTKIEAASIIGIDVFSLVECTGNPLCRLSKQDGVIIDLIFYSCKIKSVKELATYLLNSDLRAARRKINNIDEKVTHSIKSTITKQNTFPAIHIDDTIELLAGLYRNSLLINTLNGLQDNLPETPNKSISKSSTFKLYEKEQGVEAGDVISYFSPKGRRIPNNYGFNSGHVVEIRDERMFLIIDGIEKKIPTHRIGKAFKAYTRKLNDI